MESKKTQKPVSEKETVADKLKSKKKTDREKKELIEIAGSEKFKGSLRHKTGNKE